MTFRIPRPICALAVCAAGVFAQPTQPFKPLPSNAVFRDERPRIPLLGPGLTPVVAVAVGKRGPLPLLFDTGCSNLILFDYIAKPVGLEPRAIPDQRVATGGGSAVKSARAARVEKLYLLDGGDARGYVTDVDALLFESGPRVAGIRTHGVFGARLVRPLLVTFDLKAKWMSFEVGALPEPDGERVLAMNADDLSFEGRVGHRTARFTIDTGYDGILIVPPAVAKGLKFKREPLPFGSLDSAGGSFPNRIARLDGDVKLGAWTLHEPIVNICAATVQPNLGVRALRHFVVSIDQSHGRVRLDRDGDATIHTLPHRRLAISVEARDDECVVTTVEEGSPAHASGLRVGDVVLEAEGLPGREFTNDHIAELEREFRRRGVRLKIRRGGEAKRVDVPFGVIVP